MRAATISLAICAVVWGLAAPRVAMQLAHGLVAIAAIGVLTALIQSVLGDWDIVRARPFATPEQRSSPPIAPLPILELANDLATPGRTLAPKVTSQLRAIAHRRLHDRHPRNADDIDPARLGTPLSPLLTSLLDERDESRLDANDLDAILTELEQL